jgi:hypothetical protein
MVPARAGDTPVSEYPADPIHFAIPSGRSLNKIKRPDQSQLHVLIDRCSNFFNEVWTTKVIRSQNPAGFRPFSQAFPAIGWVEPCSATAPGEPPYTCRTPAKCRTINGSRLRSPHASGPPHGRETRLPCALSMVPKGKMTDLS